MRLKPAQQFVRQLLQILPLFICLNAMSLEYGGDINSTQWRTFGSIFECNFEQEIPGYGTANFYHRAGEGLSFRLNAKRNLMDYSYAQVSILPAPWQPSADSESLGRTKINKKEPQVRLDTKRSNQFMHALLEGLWPSINHLAFYDGNKSIRIRISAVQFKTHYQDYMSCIKQLLPMNFDQVSKQKIMYDSAQEYIDARDKKILDRVIFYIKKDPRVFAVYLDGHADSVGRRYDNRQMSRKRVEDVERYFIKKGIDSEMLTTRFHGSRYPIASNKTSRGRAANRRVTIRLEKRDDMPIPDELLFKPKKNK